MPSERIDPIERPLPGAVAPVPGPLLTPVEREAERRRREERRRRAPQHRAEPAAPPADGDERPRIDVRG